MDEISIREDDEGRIFTTNICKVCGEVIEPGPRYYTKEGYPRHMLCKEDNGS